MKYFSQKDPKYKNLEIAKGIKIEFFGCFFVSCCILFETPPHIALPMMKKAGCFTKEGYLIAPNVAKLFGYKYSKSKDHAVYPCIAETDHYKKVGYPQHFYILVDDNRRVDPLDLKPKPEPDYYNTVSFRIFKKA